jgi:cytochrome c oxidase subunit 2
MMGPIQSSAISWMDAVAWAMIPLQPTSASSIADGVDQLYLFLTGITLFFTVLIFSIIFYFMIKYRRRSNEEVPPEVHSSLILELTWTIIPSLICVVIFVWASELYVRNARPPDASTEIFVIGKQWMWHIQHPEGPREINELHVPVNEPVKVTMTSQDVIHDFYIPAFRVKKDVLPGRYTSIWFQATQTGTFHLFCAQYCGTDHAEMIGWIYVMTPTDYTAWLAGGEKTISMTQRGEQLYSQFGCVGCHAPGDSASGPSLVGLYGKPQKLSNGQTQVLDEDAIRQSLMVPNSVSVAGYKNNMPTYKGQMTEEQVMDLIAFVKSLGSQEKENGK